MKDSIVLTGSVVLGYQGPMTHRLISSTLFLLAGLGSATAMESQIVGPRAMAMGGVGVACADDYVAQYYNPALFGFFARGGDKDERHPADNQDLRRKDWGLGIDLSVGGRIGGDIVTYADQLADIDADRLRSLSSLASANDPAAVQDAVRMASVIGSLKAKTDSATMVANAGVGLRIGSFGVGVRGFADATAWAEVIDTTNIGVGSTPITVNELAQNLVAAAPTAPGYTATFFSGDQLTQIENTMIAAGATAGNAHAAALALDQQAAASGVDPSQATAVVNALSGANGVIHGLASGGLIDNNATLIKVSGMSVAELAFTYGYAFNDHLAIGATAKLLVGRVYGVPWYPFLDDRDYSDILSDARKNYRQTVNGAIDLGIVARMKWLQAGITGRNLNSPSFKGPTVATVNGGSMAFASQRLDRSVTAGAAFIPHPTLTVAADADLLTTHSSREGYDQQRVGAGIEWDAFRVIALRAGLSKNVAQGDTGLLYHGGIGLNLWAMRIDLGGMMSSETVTYDNKDYPREAQVALALATDW